MAPPLPLVAAAALRTRRGNSSSARHTSVANQVSNAPSEFRTDPAAMTVVEQP